MEIPRAFVLEYFHADRAVDESVLPIQMLLDMAYFFASEVQAAHVPCRVLLEEGTSKAHASDFDVCFPSLCLSGYVLVLLIASRVSLSPSFLLASTRAALLS